MPDAVHEYVVFLHRETLWRRLQVRNYDLKRMYARVSLFHAHYTIEEFEFDLRELGIIPANAKKVQSRRQREKRTYKRITKRNKRYAHKGRELTGLPRSKSHTRHCKNACLARLAIRESTHYPDHG